MTPRDFIKDYVDPAIELYRTNRMAHHLAAHAIAQLDILAEVVAFALLANGRPALARGEASSYRRDVSGRERDLKIVIDAHESHKHGRLDRTLRKPADPQGASLGQRPDASVRHGFFLSVTVPGGPLTPFGVLELELNDGTKEEVWGLLSRARKAWDRELARQGL